MGILDDLAMGFGMKARTEDYDARTARTIALNERFGTGPNADVMGRSRALANQDYDVTSGQAGRFLASRGRENYNPQIIARDQDDRGFFQRVLYSPESPESPSPYAIGPMKLDGPLKIPSMFGILNSVANAAFDRPLAGKPLSSGAVDALDGTKPFNKVSSSAGILPADDGQITEEELADVTDEAAASNEFEGMNATEIKDALMAKFNETGVDPTLEFTADLFGGDETYINYLNTRPILDKVTAYANRLAGR